MGMPERTQRGGRKCLFGVFASLTKVQACATSRHPLWLCPSTVGHSEMDKRVPGGVCPSQPPRGGQQSTPECDTTEDLQGAAGLGLGILPLTV